MFEFGNADLPAVTVPGDAAEPVRHAAEELRRYLALVLGKSPRRGPGEQGPRIEISVEADDALGDEGYELVCGDRVFKITGGGPAGALYGVYEFLRRYCGCRFSGLGPDGELVPRLPRVKVPGGRWRRKPELWYRGLQAPGRSDNKELDIQRFDWMVKNGMNYVMVTPVPDIPSFRGEATFDPQTGRAVQPISAGRYTNRWFRENWLPEIRKRGLKVDMNHHNLFYWLPPDVYYQAHPEWYALVNGERVRKAHQLCVCTSNDEAVETIIANVKAYLRANPEVGIVGIIPEDGTGFCLCDACRRQDESPDDVFQLGGALRTRESDAENPSVIRRYIRLVNRVARAVRDEFPRVNIGSAHYVGLVFAPRGIRLEPNVVPWIAMYWRCGAHTLTDPACPINDAFRYELKKWVDLHGNRVILYEYYMGMSAQLGAPYPVADVLCAEWPALKKLGIGGATVQSSTATHNTYALNYLAFARLGWDDVVDYKSLLDEYLQGMYGSCADAVRPIYEQFVAGRKQGRAPQPLLAATTGSRENRAGCIFPDARNMTTLVGAPGFESIAAAVDAAQAAASGAREKRQARNLAAAARYWRLLHDAAPLITEMDAAEARVGRLAAEAWLRLEAGISETDPLQLVGRMSRKNNALAWRDLVRRKSDTRTLVKAGKIAFRAVANGPAVITVNCDGVEESPVRVFAGQTFTRYASQTLRAKISNAPSLSLLINGESLACHKKRVTIVAGWREHPKHKGRQKVFCVCR